VAQQADAQPQQIQRTQHGQDVQRDRHAGEHRTDARSDQPDREQMTRQQSGHRRHHRPPAQAGGDRVRPIRTGGEHEEDGHRPEGGNDAGLHGVQGAVLPRSAG
jgi:hypothetical protein